MAGAPIPENEHARLLDLAQYDVLDTPSDPALERVTWLTAHLLRVPLAIINFVEGHRQWGTALVGTESTEAPREHSFCAWTIGAASPMVVPDAQLDPRFAENPMVTGDPGIRLYAGAPLQTPLGGRIGTLCVVDRVPRTLNEDDLRALQALAALATDVLELRRLQREGAGAGQQALALEAPDDWQDRHAQVLEAIEKELRENPNVHGALHAARLLHAAVSADWSGLVQSAPGGIRVDTARAHAGLRVAPERLEQYLSAERPLTRRLSGLERPLYEDTYALHPNAAPFVPDLDNQVQSAAWLPLHGGSVLTFLRLAGPAVRPWSAPDRALLEAATRMVSHALENAEEQTGQQ